MMWQLMRISLHGNESKHAPGRRMAVCYEQSGSEAPQSASATSALGIVSTKPVQSGRASHLAFACHLWESLIAET